MIYNTAPKSIRENLARAKNYLRRNELIRSIEAGCAALDEFYSATIIGQGRYEVEVLIHEYINDLNRHPEITDFFTKRKIFTNPFFTFARGMERDLANRLETVLHSLKTLEQQEKQEQAERKVMKKEDLIKRGTALLQQGEAPQGKGLLRRVVEGWGNEEGIICAIAQLFLQHELWVESADLFLQALEKFPNDPKAYKGAIQAYRHLREFEKVEKLYLLALRQFGVHPRTMLNIAQFYTEWRKYDDAYDFVKRALEGDPTLEEARILRAEIEKRIF